MDTQKSDTGAQDHEKIFEELNKRYLLIFNSIKERFKMKSKEYEQRISQLEEEN